MLNSLSSSAFFIALQERSLDKGRMDKEENKEASVSISNNDTGTNDMEDDDNDDDDGKHTVVLGPQVPLKDHLELDKVTQLCPIRQLHVTI